MSKGTTLIPKIIVILTTFPIYYWPGKSNISCNADSGDKSDDNITLALIADKRLKWPQLVYDRATKTRRNCCSQYNSFHIWQHRVNLLNPASSFLYFLQTILSKQLYFILMNKSDGSLSIIVNKLQGFQSHARIN